MTKQAPRGHYLLPAITTIRDAPSRRSRHLSKMWEMRGIFVRDVPRWLKEDPPPKVYSIVVTFETSHAFSGWLTEGHTVDGVVHVGHLRDVRTYVPPTHAFSGWLNLCAQRKMPSNVVTFETLL